MTRNDQTIKSLLEYCSSLTEDELRSLEQWQLDVIDATDTNWCHEAFAENGFESIDQAVSAAIFAAYEQVTDRYATPENY